MLAAKKSARRSQSFRYADLDGTAAALVLSGGFFVVAARLRSKAAIGGGPPPPPCRVSAMFLFNLFDRFRIAPLADQPD